MIDNSETSIQLKPSPIFAFYNSLPAILCTIAFTWLANGYFPGFIWFSIPTALFAIYRYISLRQVTYLVAAQYIRITTGIIFKEIDTIELFRVKDYIISEPLLLQVFKLMHLHLKTTDPQTPVLWLRGIPQSNIVEIIRERVLASRQYNRVYEIN